MSIELDARQIEYRGILQQLFPYVAGETLDILLASINADLTVPLRVDATSTPSLVVDIGPAIVSNPESNRNRSISFINNVIPAFASGTVTFPSASGGNITTSTGGSTLLTLPSNEYMQVLLSLDQSGNLIATTGTPNAIAADAAIPTPLNSTLPFAYITIFNNAGTIQNITQSTIFQFVGGGGSGGGGGGAANEVALSQGTTTVNVTFVTPQGSNTYVVIAQLVNTTDPDPEFQPITITNKTTTGFTATWNMPLDTANYKLDYLVGAGTIEQVGEFPLTMGEVTATITLNVPMSSSSYVVTAELANYTDATPQFQPITVTNKTTTTFTVKWNMPVDTNNYRVAWQLAGFQ
jgi:hypothetical protein